MRRLAYAALAVTCFGFLVLLALGIYYRQSWDPLIIPTWITGMATFGLFVGAVVTAIYAQRTFAGQAEEWRSQADELRNQRAHDRRRQAELVSAWWAESGPEGHSGAFVRNASGAPVYQADVTVLDPVDQHACAKAQRLVLPPSEEAMFFTIDMSARANTRVDGGGTIRRVKLCFTDAASVRWMRDEFGRLNELGHNMHVMTDQMRERVFKQFSEDFKATYGVDVDYDVKRDGYPQTKFIADLLPGPGAADAMIAPHDWIGDLIEHDIIEPTVLSDDQRKAFPAWTLNALTLEDRLYGIPMTIDTVALITNTDLVHGLPPGTFDELIDTAERLRTSNRGVTDLFAVRVGEGGDPFQIWPLFASAGGQLFAQTAEGGWDYRDIRLATDESIAAFSRLRELGEGDECAGVLRRSMGSADAFDTFKSGRTAFLITTSDGMLKARDAGIQFAVSAVPPFRGGEPAKAFRLVHGLFMAKQAKNTTIAHDLFADYLTQRRVMETLSENIVCPVAVRIIAADADPGIAEYQRLCDSDDSSMSMPTFRQMEQVWRIVGRAQAEVIAGAPPRLTAERAEAEVKALFPEP